MIARYCVIQIILLLTICLPASARILAMTEDQRSVLQELLEIERKLEINDDDIETIYRGLRTWHPSLASYAIRCILLHRLDSLWFEAREELIICENPIVGKYTFILADRIFRKSDFRYRPILDMLPKGFEEMLEKKTSPPKPPWPLSDRMLMSGSGYFLLDLVVVDACMIDVTPNNSDAREWLKDYQLAIEHEELLNEL